MNLIFNVLWGYHVLFFITAVGMNLSFRTGFFQIRHFFRWIKYAFCSDKDSEGGINAFAALSTALAGSIGTGNIVGVAAAISIGGAGAVFWMWIAAFFGMMTVFAECALSVYFDDGKSKGAFSYIKRIGKGKILPYIYGVGCFLSALTMGNMAQSNAVAQGMAQLGVPPVISAVFLIVLVFLTSKGGIKFVSKLTEKLVPFMTLIFFIVSIALLFKMRDKIPCAINEIMEGAFSKEAFLGGSAFLAIKTGISRSVFTNEAGLGSSAAAFCEVKNKDPLKMGYLGIFQVFMDTTVMCLITALCILTGTHKRNGDLLAINAFSEVFGDFGRVMIVICMVLFALATVIASGYYGKVGLCFISKGKLNFIFPYAMALFAFMGALWRMDKIFMLSDIFNGLMAIPNLLSLCYFTEIAVEISKGDKNKLKSTQKTPLFVKKYKIIIKIFNFL
ncbi:MAG: sodium:alanine symporter family protein [Ruminococcaceae bacterium]|nr:sodium:alanine symporter family protein [Oscillospiraceae bacterium]